MKIGGYELENDVDYKCILDGFEISSRVVKKYDLDPSDFKSAYWGSFGGIIVEDV
ncbi:MAG: hypothetical protein JJV89_01710 [Desulfosarcina sp.]|nr:hypothetical protein [Desulfobacterales bacterium]